MCFCSRLSVTEFVNLLEEFCCMIANMKATFLLALVTARQLLVSCSPTAWTSYSYGRLGIWQWLLAHVIAVIMEKYQSWRLSGSLSVPSSLGEEWLELTLPQGGVSLCELTSVSYLLCRQLIAVSFCCINCERDAVVWELFMCLPGGFLCGFSLLYELVCSYGVFSSASSTWLLLLSVRCWIPLGPFSLTVF